MTNVRIVILAGDGIGPEVTAQAQRVLELLSTRTKTTFSFDHQLIGGAAIDVFGEPLPSKTLEACKQANAILLGAVGGPKWPTPEHPGIRPELGLLALRKELDLFANIRPCKFPSKSLLELSPLKKSVVEGTHFVMVRELTGGIYFGKREEEDEKGYAYDTMEYTKPEVERIARVACSICMQSNPPLPLMSIDKANVLATSRLWRKYVTKICKDEFPLIKLTHQLVDSCAMIMIKDPTSLNGVLLTENMFGDILSDESSVIPGSLGLLPSASLSNNINETNVLGMYEPIHGSAPDIAGLGFANPIGTILSAAMMLEYSLNMPKEARAIEQAVAFVLDEDKLRTRDLGGLSSTSDIGDAVVKALGRILDVEVLK